MTDREIIEDFKDLVEESRQEDIYEYYYKLLNVLNLIQKKDTEINKLKQELEETNQRLQEIELQVLEEDI